MKMKLDHRSVLRFLFCLTGLTGLLNPAASLADGMYVPEQSIDQNTNESIKENKLVSLYANDSSLSAFLEQLYLLSDSRLVLENSFHSQRLNGFYNGTVEQVFKTLADEFDLEKFEFNDTVYISNANTHITMDWLFDAEQTEYFVALFSDNKSTDHDSIVIVDDRVEVTAHRELLRILVKATEQDPLLIRRPNGRLDAVSAQDTLASEEQALNLVFESTLYSVKQNQWQAVERSRDTNRLSLDNRFSRVSAKGLSDANRVSGESTLR